jgi:hypothetical protein
LAILGLESVIVIRFECENRLCQSCESISKICGLLEVLEADKFATNQEILSGMEPNPLPKPIPIDFGVR